MLQRILLKNDTYECAEMVLALVLVQMGCGVDMCTKGVNCIDMVSWGCSCFLWDAGVEGCTPSYSVPPSDYSGKGEGNSNTAEVEPECCDVIRLHRGAVPETPPHSPLPGNTRQAFEALPSSGQHMPSM